MTQPIPPGQSPIDPRAAFNPAPPSSRGPGYMQQGPPPGWMPPYPPMMFPPPPPKRRRLGWFVITSLLLVLLVISILFNVGMGALAIGNAMDGKQIAQTTVLSGSSDQQVAVISLDGVITDVTRQKFEAIAQE